MSFGCGKCIICRINKRREWTARLMMEASLHDSLSFVTLTYNDANLPDGGELYPRHLTNFFKRLRKDFARDHRKIRFYACGEYGEEKHRPHYHAILFGVSELEVYRVERNWRKGDVHVGSVTQQSIQYVCGYVLKKGLFKKAGIRNTVEFSRMSLRPGIGGDYSVRLADTIIESKHVPLQMEVGGDVSCQVRFNGKLWPIGRYIKNRFRKEVGLNEETVKAFNKEFARQDTKAKIADAETCPSIQHEVMQLKTALREKRIQYDEYAHELLTLYNRSRIELSEALSRIYRKERTLDNA